MDEIAAIQIRYDGADADRHEIELGALGQSLQGVARLISMTGNFAVTGKVVVQAPAMDVRVVIRETKANCFTVDTVLQFVQQHGILSGAIPTLIGAIISVAIYRASSRRKEEMKHLSDNLSKSIELAAQGNSETVARMTSLVENLVEALKPALRQAVEPVGRTCTSMQIGSTGVITEAMAEAIRSDDPETYETEQDFTVRITELDLENRTGKVRIEGSESDRRVRVVISDPMLSVPGNAYTKAFVDAAPLPVRAKAGIRDGAITVLHISDARSP